MKYRPGEERLLTSYLLGETSELEQTLLETSYFRDPQFHELLLAAEEDLISDYLNGLLTAHEWRRFEEHFLKSARRRQKCEAARRLIACLAQRPRQANEPSSPKPGSSRLAPKGRRSKPMYFV